MLANGFLLLVGASPPKIQNGSKITKLEFNNLIHELAPGMVFDTIYMSFPEEDKEPINKINASAFNFLSDIM